MEAPSSTPPQPPGISPPAEKEAQTRFDRMKQSILDHRLAAILVVATAILGGIAQVTGNLQQLVSLLLSLKERPIETNSGPSLLVDYLPAQRQIVLRFSLALRQKSSSGDLLQSATANLDSVPPWRSIYFSGNEVQCANSQVTGFPISLDPSSWLKLECVLTKELGVDSDAALLRAGWFRLQINVQAKESRVAPAEICYYLRKGAVQDMHFGTDLPKRFSTSTVCKFLQK